MSAAARDYAPDPFHELTRRQDGVLSWGQLRGLGVTEGHVRRQLRRGEWVRVRHGCYLVDATRDAGRDLLVQARAVSLTLPDAVLAGCTAGRLWGLAGLPELPVEVAVPRDRALRSRADLRPHVWPLAPGEVTTVRGMRVTTVARTLQDVVPAVGRLAGLAVLDSALRRPLIRQSELRLLRHGVAGRPGSAMVDDLWGWADGRAESVLESRVRLRCIEAALPPDELQLEVRDGDGLVIARADMAYVRRSRVGRGLLLVEADGSAVHSRPDAVFTDRTRSNSLMAMGHDVIRFTWRDTVDALCIPRVLRAAI